MVGAVFLAMEAVSGHHSSFVSMIASNKKMQHTKLAEVVQTPRWFVCLRVIWLRFLYSQLLIIHHAQGPLRATQDERQFVGCNAYSGQIW